MLKFTMLSITYLKREGQHQIFEKVSANYKWRNLLQFYRLLFIRTPFPYLIQSTPEKLDRNRCLQIYVLFTRNDIVHKTLTSVVDKGVNALNWVFTIFKEEKVHLWYIKTWFPGWQEIKSLTWEITFFKNVQFLSDYFLMKIIH